MATSMRERAIKYTMGVLRHASDWQEGQTALGNHDEFGPWLTEEFPDMETEGAAEIIRAAEERLGHALPY